MPEIFTGSGIDAQSRAIRDKSIMAHGRNFPNFIDSYIKFTLNQESTKRIHTWVAISIIAAALERKVWLDAGHFTVYPNFYIFIIGESGTVRKSTSTGIGVSLLRALNSLRIMNERVTDASLIDQMRRSTSEFNLGTKKQVQSSIYAFASELIVFMREVSGPISELLTTFWDCPQEWTYETKRDGEMKIIAPCLNLLGASTPTWLSKSIPVEELEGGLASRVMFVVERENPDRFIAWPELDAEAVMMRPKLIADLRQIHALSGPFSVTPAAKKFYEDWYIGHKMGHQRAVDPRFKGYQGRKPVTVWKLAMVLAVAESNKLEFDVHHIKHALELLEGIEINMNEAFGGSGENKLASGIFRILQILQALGTIPHKRICQLLWQDYTGLEIDQIVKDLQSLQEIEVFRQGGEIHYKLKGFVKTE